MQFFRPFAAVADQQDARKDATVALNEFSEPQLLDEALLAQVSGGAKTDAPGNGW